MTLHPHCAPHAALDRHRALCPCQPLVNLPSPGIKWTNLVVHHPPPCPAGKALVRLELNDNPFTEEAAPQLAAMLRQQPHLLRLNLSDTSMCDEGISTLAEALSEGAGLLRVKVR